MTRGDKGKLFIRFVPLFTLSLFSKIVCSLWYNVWLEATKLKLTLLPMCGFIAQLVEHRTGIAEVMGSNPVEALIFFFRLLLSNCLNWKIYCDDHTSLSLTCTSLLHAVFWCLLARIPPPLLPLVEKTENLDFLRCLLCFQP